MNKPRGHMKLSEPFECNTKLMFARIPEKQEISGGEKAIVYMIEIPDRLIKWVLKIRIPRIKF